MQPVKNRYNFLLQIVREHEVALAPVAPACSTNCSAWQLGWLLHSTLRDPRVKHDDIESACHATQLEEIAPGID